MSVTNNHASDREILIRVETKVNDMYRRLFGNGQPGDLADLRDSIDKVADRTTILEKEKSKAHGFIAAIGTLATLVGGAEVLHFFRSGK